MRILLWHVHGGWMEGFIRGGHDYIVPKTNEGGPWGLGRGGRAWPENVIEAEPAVIRSLDIDVVVLQRPAELAVVERLLRRRIGKDLPAVYVEHNTPRVNVPETVHPLATRDDVLLVHVTAFNALMWDNGRAPVRVIDHGVPDPGYRYTGRMPRLAVSANEPVRRSRVLGTDLLPRFAASAPIDLFGLGADAANQTLHLPPERLTVIGDVGPDELHDGLAQRRAYLHPVRWTSLGLSLIEAMLLGMPVLVLSTTQAADAIPDAAGAVSLDIERLVRTARRYLDDPDAARAAGRVARAAALEAFGLERFLADWDDVLDEAVTRTRGRAVLTASRRESTT